MKQVRNDLLVSTNSTILTKIIELKIALLKQGSKKRDIRREIARLLSKFLLDPSLLFNDSLVISILITYCEAV